VEDNPALRIALIDNLTALNYRTLGASNGREALA
jgi:CheY-like chemotaxis protein